MWRYLRLQIITRIFPKSATTRFDPCWEPAQHIQIKLPLDWQRAEGRALDVPVSGVATMNALFAVVGSSGFDERPAANSKETDRGYPSLAPTGESWGRGEL